MFLSDIKDEDISADWLLQHLQRAKVSMQDMSGEATGYWRGYNKALVEIAESVERRAKHQIKERRAGATSLGTKDEAPGTPPG